MIFEKLASEINLPVSDEVNSFKVIDENSLKTIETLSAKQAIHGIDMDIYLVIFPAAVGMGISLLLGMDFLQTNGIQLCVKRNMLIKHFTDRGKTEIYLNKSGKLTSLMLCRVKCYAAQNYKIELGEAKPVNITCGGIAMNPSDLLLYTDEDMDVKFTNKVQGMAGILDSSEK